MDKSARIAIATLAIGLVVFGFALSEGFAWMRSSQGGSMMGGGSMMSGMMSGGSMMGGMMGGVSMLRHGYFMSNGLPAAYEGKVTPLSFNPYSGPLDQVVEAGAELYADNCAACHGPKGLGDGETGVDLDPRPANLAFFVPMPMATDSYLLWTVSDGGEAMGSAMPAFKDILAEEDIWKIVAYLRSGLPRE